jgi:hypothetical protein
VAAEVNGATATSRRKPTVDESEQPFCSLPANGGQKGHFAQLLQLLADQLGNRLSVEFDADVRNPRATLVTSVPVPSGATDLTPARASAVA